VSKEQRTYGMSFYIFMIHLAGDFPSPFLFGVIADVTSSLRTAMLLCWSVLVPSFILYFIAWRVAKAKLKKRRSDKRDQYYYEKKTLADT